MRLTFSFLLGGVEDFLAMLSPILLFHTFHDFFAMTTEMLSDWHLAPHLHRLWERCRGAVSRVGW